MITIFNRCELCTTMNMEEQYRIRSILAQNNIDYSVSTTNLLNPSSRTISMGIDMNKAFVYKIYVRKKDCEEATYLINKR